MVDLRLRTYAWSFSGILIAYSIAFCFYKFGDVTALQLPTAFLELASVLNFFIFAVHAFQILRLKWLWALLALAIEISLPASIMFIITRWLYEIDAPHGWWFAAFFAITALKLSIVGCIYLWRTKRSDAAVAAVASSSP
jgi:hypothetical protein